jgi:hypothetical protein
MNINTNNPYLQLLNQNSTPAPPSSCISYNLLNHDNEIKCEYDSTILNEINNNILKLLEKKIKNKKNTYFKITRAMFDNDILSNYPDFPLEQINLLYSDGKDYFIEIANKKYPLNKKYFLKFINYILK